MSHTSPSATLIMTLADYYYYDDDDNDDHDDVDDMMMFLSTFHHNAQADVKLLPVKMQMYSQITTAKGREYCVFSLVSLLLLRSLILSFSLMSFYFFLFTSRALRAPCVRVISALFNKILFDMVNCTRVESGLDIILMSLFEIHVSFYELGFFLVFSFKIVVFACIISLASTLFASSFCWCFFSRLLCENERWMRAMCHCYWLLRRFFVHLTTRAINSAKAFISVSFWGNTSMIGIF